MQAIPSHPGIEDAKVLPLGFHVDQDILRLALKRRRLGDQVGQDMARLAQIDEQLFVHELEILQVQQDRELRLDDLDEILQEMPADDLEEQ